MRHPQSDTFDLVMFDLDGTLVETAAELADAVNDALAGLALPTVSQQQVVDWIGLGTHELLVQALSHATGQPTDAVRGSDLLASAETAFDQHYRRRCGTSSRLYPQVRETLRELRRQGVKLALVTNKAARFTGLLLDSHQLATAFDCVVSGDTLQSKKPAPHGIQHCLHQLDVLPARALFVGDSLIDVQAARSAGVAVWVLPGGYNMGQPIAASRPDRVIDNLGMLVQRTGVERDQVPARQR